MNVRNDRRRPCAAVLVTAAFFFATLIAHSLWIPQQLVLQPAVHRLSLVTCYPFDSLTAGGPLRYVVTALPVR